MFPPFSCPDLISAHYSFPKWFLHFVSFFCFLPQWKETIFPLFCVFYIFCQYSRQKQSNFCLAHWSGNSETPLGMWPTWTACCSSATPWVANTFRFVTFPCGVSLFSDLNVRQKLQFHRDQKVLGSVKQNVFQEKRPGGSLNQATFSWL